MLRHAFILLIYLFSPPFNLQWFSPESIWAVAQPINCHHLNWSAGLFVKV